MNKHTSRLAQTGTGPAWQSQQVYMRMLRCKPAMRYRVKKLCYLSEPPSDPVIFGDSHGTVYFNEATGVVSVVLADLESDAEELAAGQVGPIGYCVVSYSALKGRSFKLPASGV